MPALDLEELERVARDAAEHLPGEWRTCTDEDDPASVAFLDKHAGEERLLSFAHCSGGCLEWVHASEHIATFDPPTVLRLLEGQRDLLAELKWLAAFADVRSKDESKVFARVNRAALRNIAERAGAAIAKATGAPS